MKNIAIIIPHHASSHVIVTTRFMLQVINQMWMQGQENQLLQVHLVGYLSQVKVDDGTTILQTDALFSTKVNYDIVIIPPTVGNFVTAIADNCIAIEWIRQQYAYGAEIASFCVGAFLLAATGLANGKHCSTHWSFLYDFEQMFPLVIAEHGKIITEDNGIYSSGGASSCWNLLLHLVEKMAGREMAITASKYFAIDIDRNSQASFTIFKAQKEHGDAAILQVQIFIENNIAEKFTIASLASQVSMGRRSLERRFKQATGNSILLYIQRVKIEVAKRSLENTRNNINEVMYAVGYTDTKAFRTIFKKVTGLSPLAYKNKYYKNVAA